MPAPVRFPNGVNNVTPDELLSMYPLPFTMDEVHEWGEDFDRYRSADWTVTVVGTGTVAQANAVGGVIDLTTSAGATDAVYVDKVGESSQFISGKKLWFRSRFYVTDTTNTEVVAGLQITDTTPMAVTDGVYFHKPSGATALFLVQISAATGLTTTTNVGVAMTNSAYYDVGFYYDGKSTLYYEVLDSTGAVVSKGSVASNLPTVTQTLSMGILNAAAAAHTMRVDYIWAGQEVSR